jgi:hypothetical protein
MSAGGNTGVGAQRLAYFMSVLEKKGIDTKGLAVRIATPVLFIPTHGGRPAYGYEATVLPEVCNAILEARRTGLLQRQQEHLAERCEILVRALAQVGIIALVDEATGYQDSRARDALAKILEKFIAKELRKWIKTFPSDFYRELFRLRGWPFPVLSQAKPPLVGKLTNNLVYQRLAPGVLGELRRLTPRNDQGRLKHHLHRWLTEDTGHPKLREHLAAVIALMRASETWENFVLALDRALPRYDNTESLDLKSAEETQS